MNDTATYQIKAQELRIGNYLIDKLTGAYLKAHSLNDEGQIGTEVIDRSKFPLPEGWQMAPIELTPDVLKQCAFVHRSIHGNLYDKEYQVVSMSDGKILDKTFCVATFDSFCVVLLAHHTHIKYLHQLQNLYFALTGEELEINL